MQKSNVHSQKSGMLLPLIKALGAAVLAGAVLLGIFCFVSLRFDDPEKVAPVFSYLTLAVVAFAGGYMASRLYGENGTVCGLVFGILLVAVMILLCFALTLSVSPLAYAISATASIGLAMLGGRSAVRTPSRRKKPRKRK